MMRRDLVGDTRFHPDLFIGEDYYFIYENLIKDARSVFLNQKWYYARLHPNNTSKQYDFNAFWTRFYRRKLVWESEERFGRSQYASIQKRDAFAVFLRCIMFNKPNSRDYKKITAVLREHKKDLIPALPFRGKLLCYSAIYTPILFRATFKIKAKLKRVIF